MKSFGIRNVKFEKAKANARYRRRQKVTALFRFVEFCVVLIAVSRFSAQFPLSLMFSGEYLRSLSVTLFSPRFVFVVGNSIVVVLFLKSGQFTARDHEKIDFYDEFKERCGGHLNSVGGADKSLSEENFAVGLAHNPKERKIRRSRSENLRITNVEEPLRELRRSASEKDRSSVNQGEKTASTCYAEDKMSSEEFRRTVEAFISRQQRFLREQDFSAFVSLEA